MIQLHLKYWHNKPYIQMFSILTLTFESKIMTAFRDPCRYLHTLSSKSAKIIIAFMYIKAFKRYMYMYLLYKNFDSRATCGIQKISCHLQANIVSNMNIWSTSIKNVGGVCITLCNSLICIFDVDLVVIYTP